MECQRKESEGPSCLETGSSSAMAQRQCLMRHGHTTWPRTGPHPPPSLVPSGGSGRAIRSPGLSLMWKDRKQLLLGSWLKLGCGQKTPPHIAFRSLHSQALCSCILRDCRCPNLNPFLVWGYWLGYMALAWHFQGWPFPIREKKIKLFASCSYRKGRTQFHSNRSLDNPQDDGWPEPISAG